MTVPAARSEALVADLAVVAIAMLEASAVLQAATLEACAGELAATGAEIAERFRAGGRLFAFGNGGSATDADSAVHLFRAPPSGRPLPAVSLVGDGAVLSAIADDVGGELAFSRQLLAHARPVDVALGFSASGSSPNLLRAFSEARARGLLTVGMSGYCGGAMASAGTVAHCFVVGSDSVHRIQEVQAALVLALWRAAQEALEAPR